MTTYRRAPRRRHAYCARRRTPWGRCPSCRCYPGPRSAHHRTGRMGFYTALTGGLYLLVWIGRWVHYRWGALGVWIYVSAWVLSAVVHLIRS